MGDVGGHLLAELVGAVNFRAHLVEGLRQFAQFVVGAHLHLLAQFAARIARIAVVSSESGRRKLAREQQPDQQRRRARADRADQQRLIGAIQIALLARIGSRRRRCQQHRADLLTVDHDRGCPASRCCVETCSPDVIRPGIDDDRPVGIDQRAQLQAAARSPDLRRTTLSLRCAASRSTPSQVLMGLIVAGHLVDEDRLRLLDAQAVKFG